MIARPATGTVRNREFTDNLPAAPVPAAAASAE